MFLSTVMFSKNNIETHQKMHENNQAQQDDLPLIKCSKMLEMFPNLMSIRLSSEPACKYIKNQI